MVKAISPFIASASTASGSAGYAERDRRFSLSQGNRVSFPWLCAIAVSSALSVLLIAWAATHRPDQRIQPPRLVMRMAAPEAGRVPEGTPAAWVGTRRASESHDGPHDPTGPSLPETARTIAVSDDAGVEPKERFALANLVFDVAAQTGAVVPLPLPRPAFEGDVQEHTSASSLAARSMYRGDLDREVMLQPIAFPFATAMLSTKDDGGATGEATLAALDSPTPDATRFGKGQPSLRSGFASVMQPGVTAKFASFRLDRADDSWRRLAGERRARTAETVDAGSFGIPSDQNADGIDDTSFFERTIGLRYLKSRRRDATPAVAVMALSMPEGEGLSGSGSGSGAGAAAESVPPPGETMDKEASSAAAAEEEFFDQAPAGPKPATVFDRIERSARTSGLSERLTGALVQILSSEFDFAESIGTADRLDIFFSEPGPDDRATETSDIYFVRATFGGVYRTFYRFKTDDGTVAYFGPEGRTSRQLFLDSPVPGGVFSSGFGIRKHPILGYERMHNGVDWSAPAGTPIYAAAAGTVEEAGNKGGYGLQTVIRHDDGYETSYAHQSRIADAVVPGARLRQGDVIGYVGATGLATGAHIHYEIKRDGVEIDPMEVRSAERSPSLRGLTLDAFLAERDRIEDLVYRQETTTPRLASAGGG